MEIKREPLSGAPTDFRSRQLLARDMLNGDLEGEALQRYAEQAVMTTTVGKAVAWAQGNSLYPLTFGLACCAIEQITAVGVSDGHRAVRLGGVQGLAAPSRI